MPENENQGTENTITCPDCNGKKQIEYYEGLVLMYFRECFRCDGEGFIYYKQEQGNRM